MHREFLLGVVGHPSSGKDTAVGYIVSHYGFDHISTSDLLRTYIQKEHLGDLTRPNIQRVANELRREKGPMILVAMALENESSRLVLSALRAYGEIDLLRQHKGIVIAITAPIELRYQRALARGRIGEDISFEQFKTIELTEATNTDPNAQNVTAIVENADYTIENTGSQESFFEKIDTLMQQLGITKR